MSDIEYMPHNCEWATWITEHDKKIRADAIELIYKWIEEQSRILRLQSDTYNDDECFGGWRAMEDTKRYLAEQLKEQKDMDGS